MIRPNNNNPMIITSNISMAQSYHLIKASYSIFDIKKCDIFVTVLNRFLKVFMINFTNIPARKPANVKHSRQAVSTHAQEKCITNPPQKQCAFQAVGEKTYFHIRDASSLPLSSHQSRLYHSLLYPAS